MMKIKIKCQTNNKVIMNVDGAGLTVPTAETGGSCELWCED